MLVLATDPGDLGTYTCNDDDASCKVNTAASRIDVQLKASGIGARS
jgi:hypothetical protein